MQAEKGGDQEDEDFDYLNDDDEYEEDYEDYEEPEAGVKSNKENTSYKPQVTSSFTTKTLEKASVSPQQNKNTFMTYCQDEYDEENEEEGGQANWDLDIDENADFDFV